MNLTIEEYTELITSVLVRDKFQAWYNDDYARYLRQDENCKSQEEIRSDIVSLFCPNRDGHLSRHNYQ